MGLFVATISEFILIQLLIRLQLLLTSLIIIL